MKYCFGLRWLGVFFCFLLSVNIVRASSAHCDFNNDGFDDLAIGIPQEDIGSIQDAGAVQVLYGRTGGLSATNNQFWNADSPNISGVASAIDNFGYSLACGDFDGDGYDDLAVGIPGKTVNGKQGAGAVAIIFGSTAD